MTPDATYLQDSSNRLPCPRHAYPAYVNLASVGSRDSPVIRPAALGPWPLSQRPARDDPDDMSISASNRLLSALAVVATVAAGLTFWLPDILTGPAVMNGSARGTALVVLVIGVPALVVSMRPAARGSVRALAIGMGAVTYLCYNAVMFAFATPFNRLFLLYVAMLGLSVWALVGLVLHTDPSTIHTDRLPARPVAIYIWVVVALNALVWLRTIVPALFAERPTEILDGTGVATNAVFRAGSRHLAARHGRHRGLAMAPPAVGCAARRRRTRLLVHRGCRCRRRPVVRLAGRPVLGRRVDVGRTGLRRARDDRPRRCRAPPAGTPVAEP